MTVSNKLPPQTNTQTTAAGASSSTLFPQHSTKNYTSVATQIEAQFNNFERSSGQPSALGINNSEWNKFTATLGGKYSDSDLAAGKEQTETDDAFTLEGAFADVQGGNGKSFSEDDLKAYLDSVAPDLDAGVAAQVEDLARNDKTLTSGPSTGTGSGG